MWNKHSEINIPGSSINEKPNSTMSVMLCTGATFVKKNSCLVARIVSFDTVKSWNSIFLNSEFFLLTRMLTIYLPTCAFNIAARAFSLLTRGFELVTRIFELVARGFELVTRGFELVTRVLLFHPNSHLIWNQYFSIERCCYLF